MDEGNRASPGSRLRIGHWVQQWEGDRGPSLGNLHTPEPPGPGPSESFLTNWTTLHCPLQVWVSRSQSVCLVRSGLLRCEMCTENMSGSIRSWRSGSRDSECSLHTQTCLAISQIKTESTLMASPGTDRNGLPGARCQSQFLTLARVSLGLAELEIAPNSSAPTPPSHRWGK